MPKGVAKNNNNSKKKKKQQQAPRRQQAAEKEKEAEEGGVIAQIKFDGDRLQAHIMTKKNIIIRRPMMGQEEEEEGEAAAAAEEEAREVRLFTKNGFNVSELYSDVRDELAQTMQEGSEEGACVLDGELIVVGQDGEPLPWESNKWRYNLNDDDEADNHNHNDDADKEAEVGIVEHFSAVSGEGGESWEEGMEEEAEIVPPVTFVPLLRRRGQPQRRRSSSSAASSSSAVPSSRQLPAGGDDEGVQQRMEPGIRPIRGARLRFVVFDVLVWNGTQVWGQGYAARLGCLERELRPRLERAKRVGVIEGTRRIRTAAELTDLMRDGTRRGLEGYVLKDPDAPYAFERTTYVQKVKLAGPDINTGVVGAGFSQSTNPRRWGLGTALLWKPPPSVVGRDDAEGAPPPPAAAAVRTAEFYCRTETLEGDRPGRALEMVLSLTSRVRARDIRDALWRARRRRGDANTTNDNDDDDEATSSTTTTTNARRGGGSRRQTRARTKEKRVGGGANNKKKNDDEEEAGAARGGVKVPHAHFDIIARWMPPEEEAVVSVEWRGRDTSQYDGRVLFPASVLSLRRRRMRQPEEVAVAPPPQHEHDCDIDWVCSPWECPFALSLRGDLRPLEGAVPRHPVGRPEIVGLQATARWDTREGARAKFDEAAEVRLCVEMHTARRLLRLRALPPTRARMEEVGRIAMGWRASLRASAAAAPQQKEKEEEEERWPQLPPAAFATLDGLSDLLEDTARCVCERVGEGGQRRTVLSALRRLSLAERQAMANLKPHSLWARLDRLLRAQQQQLSSANNNNTNKEAGIVVGDEAALIDAAAAEAGQREHSAEDNARFEELRALFGGGLALPHTNAAAAAAASSVVAVVAGPLVLIGRPSMGGDDAYHDDAPYHDDHHEYDEDEDEEAEGTQT